MHLSGYEDYHGDRSGNRTQALFVKVMDYRIMDDMETDTVA